MQGFIPMMRHLMRDEQVQTQLLGYHDGERRLTNLLHLSELIHSESRQNSGGMEGTVRWLRQQSRQATLSSDSLQLRLESDDKLVKIVTVHKSKGLEYGLVYCPYLWADSVKSVAGDAAIMFHADDKAHTPCLDIGSPQREAHLKLLEQEAYAENMRLLYVALTRAKYHCTVVTLSEKINRYIDRSALGWLLSNGEDAKSKNFLPFYQQNIESLVSGSEGVIESIALPEVDNELSYQAKQNTQALIAREFSKVIQKDHRISSFSGLTSGNHSQVHDHDGEALLNQSASSHLLKASAVGEFPRGANAGSCLHEIYENSDFIAYPAVEEENEPPVAIINALAQWGFSPELANTAQHLIYTSLQAPLFPLNDHVNLSGLRNSQRLNEMAFFLPLGLLKVEHLKRLLLKHLSEDKWYAVREAVKTLRFEQVSGYLKGFIDLIFEHQGQYFVADYKSNTLDDYAKVSLLGAMANSHYYLQYLIYSVALHRYLQQRIANYKYETHFGGVFYLFIRGMSVDTQGAGVFYDLPSAALIEALDGLFVVPSVHI
jgi:exodeoxyribonuclease V beta subunit